jgi:RNA polymerase sigma factor (sigma-70 family)
LIFLRLVGYKLCLSFFLLIKKEGIKLEAELLKEQIKKAKESNDKDALLEIIKRMNPLIKKYIRKLYFMDKEDAAQELILSLIEAIYYIKDYNNEAMCITYLKKSIINKYNYLCKKNIREDQFIDYYNDLSEEITYGNEVDEVVFNAFLDELLQKTNIHQKQILTYILKDGLSDIEVSSKMGISRQYVNRVTNRTLKKFNSPID